MRRTPLKRGKPLKRTAMKRTGMKLVRTRNEIKAAVDQRVESLERLSEAYGSRCMGLNDDRRCSRPGYHVHHRVLRSRGGDLLDGATHLHLAHLCSAHHEHAHAHPDALLVDKRPGVIRGEVRTEINERGMVAVYVGTDTLLLNLVGNGLPLPG